MQNNFSELELITLAISMEEEGVRFYESYASGVTGALKTTLLGFAEDERRHVTIFQKLYEQAEEKITTNEYLFSTEVQEYFHGYAHSEAFNREKKTLLTVKHALLEAAETEQLTIDYYKNLLKYIDEEVKNTLQLMIDEEQTHFERLMKLYMATEE